MKALSRSQLAGINAAKARLAECAAAIEHEITEVNATIEEKVDGAIERYNEVLEELSSLRDGITEEMQSYYDDRSETWQESDAGSAYAAWKSEWEDLELDHVDAIGNIDAPDLDHGDALEALPTSTEG